MTVKRSKAAERKLKEIKEGPPPPAPREWKGGWDAREIDWDNPYGAWGEKKWWFDHKNDWYNPPQPYKDRVKNTQIWDEWVIKGRRRGHWNADNWWGDKTLSKLGPPIKVLTKWYWGRQPLQPLKTKSKKPKPLPQKPSVSVSVKKVGPPRPFTDKEIKESNQRSRRRAAEKKFEKLRTLKKAYKENNDK